MVLGDVGCTLMRALTKEPVLATIIVLKARNWRREENFDGLAVYFQIFVHKFVV